MTEGGVTVGAMERAVPFVSAGSYDHLARCQRRLHKWLTVEPGSRQRMGDRQFLLLDVVKQALAEAHQGVADAHAGPATATALGDALDAIGPPPDLAAEEAALYRQALSAYVECVDGRPGTWAGPPPGRMSRMSRTGRFGLSATVDLAFDLPDGGLEVRTVHLSRARPHGPALAERAGPRLLALVVAARPYLRLVDLDLLGTARVTETDFEFEDLASLAETVTAPLSAALDAVEPSARCGWWCAGCPFLFGCPAIPQRPVDEVVG